MGSRTALCMVCLPWLVQQAVLKGCLWNFLKVSIGGDILLRLIDCTIWCWCRAQCQDLNLQSGSVMRRHLLAKAKLPKCQVLENLVQSLRQQILKISRCRRWWLPWRYQCYDNTVHYSLSYLVLCQKPKCESWKKSRCSWDLCLASLKVGDQKF